MSISTKTCVIPKNWSDPYAINKRFLRLKIIQFQCCTFQIHGSFRSKKSEKLVRGRGNFVFDCLLPRLAFKLRDLLNPSVLYEEG